MYTYKSDFLSVESVDRTLQVLLNFLLVQSFYLSTYIYTIGRTNKRVPTGLLVNILQSYLRDRDVSQHPTVLFT